MQVSKPSIYRNDRILGLVDSELNESLYKAWGKSLARMVPKGSDFLVTSDHRKDSESFRAALAEGLLSGGVNVVDLGRIPTDIASYGTDLIQGAGCASVTGGSHSPSWNGLRWTLSSNSYTLSEQIEILRAGTKSNTLEELEKEKKKKKNVQRGTYRIHDITENWQNLLKGVWFDAPEVPLRVIVDPMYGNWAPLAQKTLAMCFPKNVFETIHNEPRADFGGMLPASRSRKSLAPLCAEVVNRQADIGIALDADAGYFAIVDHLGKPLLSEEISWILLHNLLGVALNGEIFLHDVNCSQKIISEGIRLGGTPYLVQSSDKIFVSKMKETNAIAGLSFYGSLYFRGINGNRIVLFAICWFIDYFTRLGVSLAEWRKQFPSFPIIQEIRTPSVPMEEVVRRLTDIWNCFPATTLEGIQFVVPEGRIHIRSISDFAQMGFNFEAHHTEALQHIVSECYRALEDLEHTAFFLKEGFEIGKESPKDLPLPLFGNHENL